MSDAQQPQLSEHYASRKPSAIRLAQIEFMRRRDGCEAVNVAIGNVSLPMHPAMQRRMRSLGDAPITASWPTRRRSARRSARTPSAT